ncbi:MAG: ankyrin repeat domain-containing protein [Gammaproteobacteria bacterium]|nr:ankyrin repeat domain-containing protein [Gammaproteobacteria bacterium]
MASIEAGVDAALDAEDATRLAAVVWSVDWSRTNGDVANRVLQRVALYGYSGRTERYRDIVERILAGGVAPNLATCALIQANDRAASILAATPAAAHDADESGATPLHHAAERGNAALAAMLCERGAAVDAVDHRGETPLAKALHAGPWKREPASTVVEVLRKHGASVDLKTLAAMGNADGIIAALDEGVSANTPDDLGRTPLYIAARNNHRDAVNALLARGADPNIAAQDGQTPLSTACLHTLSGECDTVIVHMLVRHGAPMTLEAAIVLEDLQALRGFLASDPTHLYGQDHESPLGYAIHAWRPASLRCLIEAGARPSAENWGHIRRIAGASSELAAELEEIANPPETPHEP